LDGLFQAVSGMRKVRSSLARHLRSAGWRHALPWNQPRELPQRAKSSSSGLRRRSGAAAALAADPLARDVRLARLEAVLFVAREPVNSRKLAQLAGLADGTEARTLIRRLNRFYDVGESAFRAEEVAGGFQLLTRPQFGPWLRRVLQSSVEARFSTPALETLAVVAYRQPVLRVEIEAIRGVDCGEILRQLMERDLVRISGRSEDLGRPYLYGTTKRFLQVFGLRHLDDLPRADVLRVKPPAPAADQPDTKATSPTDNSLLSNRELE